MRRWRAVGSFLMLCSWHLLRRFRWSIPAWILLATHFLFGTPMWLFWFALGLWIVYGILLTLFLSWVHYCGSSTPTVRKPNINPYSVQNDDTFLDKK